MGTQIEGLLTTEEIDRAVGRDTRPANKKFGDYSGKSGKIVGGIVGGNFDWYVKAVAAPLTVANYFSWTDAAGSGTGDLWGRRYLLRNIWGKSTWDNWQNITKWEDYLLAGRQQEVAKRVFSPYRLLGKSGYTRGFARFGALGGGRVIPILSAGLALWNCWKNFTKACSTNSGKDWWKFGATFGGTVIGGVLGFMGGGPLGAMAGAGLGNLIGDIASSEIVTNFAVGFYNECIEGIKEACKQGASDLAAT